MAYTINGEIEGYFKDKNIEFAVASLLRGQNTKFSEDAIVQVFNLSKKDAKLCMKLTEDIRTLNKIEEV